MAEKFISVIIPNRNGAGTIRDCLRSVFASDYPEFEVIVVDDASDDASAETALEFPCRLLKLDRHRGTSVARNTGASVARGEIFFFIDSDCILEKDTLCRLLRAFPDDGKTVLGGTYTQTPGGRKTFFSFFQSVFINYSETRRPGSPDYVASHAMAISRTAFRAANGFRENFLPIIEDVEFSHRLKRAGFALRMAPGLAVRHVFNYSFSASLTNAFRKSMYWTLYSLGNRDILADSGTASHGLKLNCLFFLLSAISLAASAFSTAGTAALAFIMVLNTVLNMKLLRAFFAGGSLFGTFAGLYYTLLYPVPVIAGGFAGAAVYLASRRSRRLVTVARGTCTGP